MKEFIHGNIVTNSNGLKSDKFREVWTQLYRWKVVYTHIKDWGSVMYKIKTFSLRQNVYYFYRVEKLNKVITS